DTHVLFAVSARMALVGPTDHRDDVVASRERPYLATDRLDTAEAFMADDEVIVAGRCLSVLRAIDLDIGSVDAHTEDLHAHIGWSDDGRRRVQDLRAVRDSRMYGNGSHDALLGDRSVGHSRCSK